MKKSYISERSEVLHGMGKIYDGRANDITNDSCTEQNRNSDFILWVGCCPIAKASTVGW